MRQCRTDGFSDRQWNGTVGFHPTEIIYFAGRDEDFSGTYGWNHDWLGEEEQYGLRGT